MTRTNLFYGTAEKHQIHQRNVRRRLTLIAFILAVTTGALGITQLVMGPKGSLLWIAMAALGFLLVGVLLLMLPGRPSIAGNNREPIAPLPWDEPSWYDTSHPGSPFHRED